MKKRNGRLMSVTEVSDFLGLTYQTIYNWVRNGVLKPIKGGKVSMFFSRKYIEHFDEKLNDLANAEVIIENYHKELKKQAAEYKVKNDILKKALSFNHPLTVSRYIRLINACANRLVEVGEVPLTDAEKIALDRILNRATIENISNDLSLTTEGARQVELRLLRKIAKISKHRDRFSLLLEENAKLREDNKKLKEALDKQTTISIPLNEAYSDMDIVLATKIDVIGLSVRAKNCLGRLGIKTIGDLVNVTERKIKSAYGAGRITINEIKNKLSDYGLELKNN